jgi:hypothetical protein
MAGSIGPPPGAASRRSRKGLPTARCKLVPLVDKLLANFGQGGATRKRMLKADGAKLTVRESIEPAAGKPAVTREVPLEFDGKRYIVPAEMQYRP